MEWFDRRYQQYVKEHRDRNTVAQFAEEIYQSLWTALSDVLRDAKSRGIDLKVNGFPLHHSVTHGKRVLKIDLSEDKMSVIARPGDGPEIHLNLAVCPDESVCLKHEGITVNYAEAAQRIMEPFLFGGTSPFATRKCR